MNNTAAQKIAATHGAFIASDIATRYPETDAFAITATDDYRAMIDGFRASVAEQLDAAGLWSCASDVRSLRATWETADGYRKALDIIACVDAAAANAARMSDAELAAWNTTRELVMRAQDVTTMLGAWIARWMLATA